MPELYTAMRKYYSQGAAPATRRSYKAGTRQYIRFCQQSSLSSIPTSEKTLLLCATHLATHGLTYATIKVYLAAVRHSHVTVGYHNVSNSHFTPRVQQLLRGIHKESSKTRWPRKRLPITLKIMQKIKHHLNKQPPTYQDKLVWAACCVAFYGFLSVSKFTVPSQHSYDKAYHLFLADLTLNSRCMLANSSTATHQQSKTDPFREGAFIFLSKSNRGTCPIRAIVDYLTVRGKREGPLFVWPDGTLLTRNLFASALARILRNVNLTPQLYNTHSFHIGTATSTNQAGLTPLQIKALGRWRSDAYQRYIRIIPNEFATMSKQLNSHDS